MRALPLSRSDWIPGAWSSSRNKLWRCASIAGTPEPSRQTKTPRGGRIPVNWQGDPLRRGSLADEPLWHVPAAAKPDPVLVHAAPPGLRRSCSSAVRPGNGA